MPEKNILNQVQKTMQAAPSNLEPNLNSSSSSQNSKTKFSKRYKKNFGGSNKIKYFLGSFALLFLVFGGAAAYYLVQQEGVGDIRQQARVDFQLDGPCNSLCMDDSHCVNGLSCIAIEDRSSAREMTVAELRERGMIPNDCSSITAQFFFKMRDNNYHKVIWCNQGESVYVENEPESVNGRPEGASSAPWNWYYLADDSELNLEDGVSNDGWARFPTESFFRGMTAYDVSPSEMMQVLASQGSLHFRQVDPQSGRWPDFQEMNPRNFSRWFQSTGSGRFCGIIAYSLADGKIKQIVAREGNLYHRELDPEEGSEPDFQKMTAEEFPQWFNTTGSGEFQLIAAYSLADGQIKQIVARGGNFYYREFDPNNSTQPDFEKFEPENFPGWETYGEIKVCRDPNCPEDSACSCTVSSQLGTDPGEGETEQQLCTTAGGEWREFSDSCVDSCGYHRDPDAGCATVMTYGCDCGPNQCWDGEECQPIASIQPPVGADPGEDETEQQLCTAAGGEWKQFSNSCVDSCYYRRNPDTNCLMVITDGCDCGPDQCWDGEECQPIAAFQPPDLGNSTSDPECLIDQDCQDGQVCNDSTNECVALTNSQILLSITASLEGVPHQSGPISHHPKEHGREISMRVTLINVSDQSNEKVIDFVYDEPTGTYQTKEAIIYDNITPGPYIIVLKGPKHLATRYCYYGETDKSCRFQDLIAISNKEQAEENNFIWLEPGKVDIDLSAQPVLAGDLPISGGSKSEQDGLVNVYDYSFLISCLGNKSRTDECLEKADLNFSKQVSNIDLMLLRRTLSQVSDQF